MLTTCVTLCTYNGERFLERQLESIAAQTRRPDLLLLVDDCSTDGTVRVARDFANRAPFPMEVVVNERNLGYVRNFQRAVELARGDVILLCDQDDVWSPHRVERVVEAFEARPELGLVFSDAELIGENDESLGERLWDALGFTRSKRALARDGMLFEVLLRGNVVTGATLAFSSRHRDLVVPFVDGVTHDAWISLMIAAVAPAIALAEPLVRYRQHAENQIGARRLTPLARLKRARESRLNGLVARRILCEEAAARLRTAGSVPERLELLAASIAHLETRARLPARRAARLPAITSEVLAGRYRRSSAGLASAVRDVLA